MNIDKVNATLTRATMSLQEREIEGLMEAVTWKKTADGYEIRTKLGQATLSKKGKKWILSVGGESVELGRRASFDHAEGILVKLGALV